MTTLTPTPTATNHLTYPGDVAADVAVGDLLGVDGAGYPYRVTDVTFTPGAYPASRTARGYTVVGLEPWPLTDLPGLERVAAARRTDAAVRAALRALFVEEVTGA